MVSYFIREISEDLVNQQSSSVHNKAYVEMCFGSLVVYTMKLIKNVFKKSSLCTK